MTHRLDPQQIEVVDDTLAEVLRHKTTWERIGMVLSADRTARLLLEGSIRTRHPDWDDARVAREVVRRIARGPS